MRHLLFFCSATLAACTGFKNAFVDASGAAFKPNRVVYLPGACGKTITAHAIDLNHDGIADGLDLNGDGIADVRYIPIIADQLVGLDANGDGHSDYYMNVGLNDELTIYTAATGGTRVALTADAAGQVTGFDITGDCTADNTIISDIRNDTTPPTSSADSAGGAFNGNQIVTLTCTDNVACNGIAYTLDGSDPNFTAKSSAIVGASGSITISEAVTLRFLARDANGNLETTIHSLSFDILGTGVALTPTFTPPLGYYQTTQNIALASATSGATICYTIGAATPTCTSAATCSVGAAYSAPIAVSTAAIINAVACKIGLSDSPIATSAYAIDAIPPGNVSAFVATPASTQFALGWTNPGDADLKGIKILRKTGGYPTSDTDGTVVYNALSTAATDTGLTNGIQYYYKAFAYDAAGNFAAGATAIATPN
ncbi:MAG: chitobiase/beta-hexosaminidase C-terminal domain-containing protein [Spirochaetes bacterium]|nr:chitobiase/beta-hexosaminidase C-terminal domain-containing protein [Spirochaetota bacterium]